MRFCNGCNNMYYIKSKEEENNNTTIVYYCRNCGKEDENIEQNYVVSSFNKSDNLSDNSFVNPYTKYDLTIPRVNTIKCINPNCKSNKEDNSNNILLIRTNEVDMKYIYLCSICDTKWKSDIK